MRTLLALLLLPAFVAAGDSTPDSKAVRRHGPAYRYPQAGWVVLHVEGEPYERGYQHGRLMGAEIAAHLRCFAAMLSPKASAENWQSTRRLVNGVIVPPLRVTVRRLSSTM